MSIKKIKGGLPSQLISRRARLALIAAFAALSSGSSLIAATVTWIGGNTGANWNVTTNWDTGALPTSADTARFSGASSLVFTGTVSTGFVSADGPTALTLSSGASVTTTSIYLNSGSLMTINGATLNSGYTIVGNSSAGTATLNSGSWTTGTGTTRFGSLAGSTGTVSINGGVFTTSGWYIGDSGTGSLNVSGGTVNGGSAALGNEVSSVGTISLAGGNTTVTNLTVGRMGTGTVNLTAGSLTVGTGTTNILLGSFYDSVGILNIGTGGTYTTTLNSGAITTGSGSGTVNFNHTNTISFSKVIAGSTVVNKLASGVTALTGASTYTGGTVVSAGTLLLNNVSGSGTGTGAVSVASLAKLGGSGTISGNVVSSGIITPGALSAIGTLSVGGDVTWNGSAGNAWQFQVASGTSDKLAITGNLIKGTGTQFAFDFLGGGTVGTYVLLEFGSSTFTSADFTATNLAAGYAATFTKSATNVSVAVSAVPEPSTIATIAGAVILGIVVIRRRKTAAVTV